MEAIGSKFPTPLKKREGKYARMVEDRRGILNLISEGKEAMIASKMYRNDCELVLQRLNQSQTKEGKTQQNESKKLAHHQTLNLPQLPLPIFSGNPKEWRGFWSSFDGFDTAVHLQNIPDIQKRNYLLAYIKGEALLTIKGYDITSKNCGVIRKVLEGKFGQSHIIKKIAVQRATLNQRRNDRELKAIVEAIERIFRQLETIGENLEQFYIENIIGTKLYRLGSSRKYINKRKNRRYGQSPNYDYSWRN